MKLYRNILWCFICVIACILFFTTKSSSAQIEVVKASEKRIEMLEVENACLKQQIEQQREFIIELQDEVEGLRADVTELKVVEEEAEPVIFEETEILAKLLYREAGSMGYEGQRYVCSAILNLSDYTGRSIWDLAHDINTMSVAPIVDSAVPNETQYQVIEDVLNGARVEEICYFRTSYYHSFGTPVCNIENVYFSKPQVIKWRMS